MSESTQVGPPSDPADNFETNKPASASNSDDDFDQMPELMDATPGQQTVKSMDTEAAVLESAGGGDHQVAAGGPAGKEDVIVTTEHITPVTSSNVPDSTSTIDSNAPASADMPTSAAGASQVEPDQSPEITSSVEDVEMLSSTGDKQADSMLDSFEHIAMPDSLYENDTPSTTDKTEEESPKSGEDNESKVMDVIGNGKILKTVITEGEGFSTRPTKGELVTIRYEGRTDDDSVVESADDFKFLLTEGDVIQGLDLAVSLMQMKEKASIAIHPDFAYGAKGCKSPSVPANARLTYTVELLKNEGIPDFGTMSFQEKFSMAEAKRLRGNSLYIRQEYHMAVNSYTRALSILECEDSPSEEEMKQLNECRMKCENNLAICQIKVGAYDAAVKSCDNVLKLDKDNVKAYFRKGKAYSLLNDHENAVKYLRQAQELEPTNKDISAELVKVTQTYRTQEDKCKAMYRNMLGNPKPTPKKKVSTFPYWILFSGSAFAAGLATIGYAVYQTMTDTIP